VPGAFHGDFGVVLFYRGSWCPYCNAQLRAFQCAAGSLAEVGASVVAMSVDDEGTTAELIAEQGLTFPVGHSDLARALDVTPSTAGRMCDRLVRKGLIRRHRTRSDRRSPGCLWCPGHGPVGRHGLAVGQAGGNIHPIYSYAHVPYGYDGDATEAIIAQIERWAQSCREHASRLPRAP
jgi:DNA-binding Lrp family transcriptional regulator